MEPPDAQLAPFAVRHRQKEERRAQVLAQRQAEREQRRAARERIGANSAAESYDPSAVAHRRRDAISAARARRTIPRPSSSDESPPPPPPPVSPTRDATSRFFENAAEGVVIFRGARPEVDEEVKEEAEQRIKDADEVFRAMLRGDEPARVPKRRAWNDDTEPTPAPRPRRSQAARRAGRAAERRAAASRRSSAEDAVIAAPEINEARRKAALEAETRRVAEAAATVRPLKQRNGAPRAVLGSKRPPLCVRREREQRKREAAVAGEPETRRCLDKRTARLRYARHFAAAVAAFRARALSPTGRRPRETNDDEMMSGARVVVRVRPLLAHEEARGEFAAVSPDLAPRAVTVHECTMHADMIRLLHAARTFPCASALGATTTEDEVFAVSAGPALEATLSGRPAVLFMFGQTGSGKTHSMAHIERRVAAALFDHEATVRVRYFEIRGKKAFDLLGADDEALGSEIRLVDEATSCRAEGAVVAAPSSASELLHILEAGKRRRATAATDVNGGSSRSHAVCRLELSGGSLTLVDCAGSERSHDSMYHDAQRRKESAEINQSIYALKACIRARNAQRAGTRAAAAPPFRSSALTRILREALDAPEAHLGVLATVSPAATDAEHSVATLRTVCELAGASPKRLERGYSPPTEVPKVLDAPAASAAAPRPTPSLPRTWTAARLAHFFEKIDPRAAQRTLATDLDGNGLLRMSVLAVAAVLTDGDQTRATKLIYAARDETARVERLRFQARAKRRASVKGRDPCS